MYALGFVIWANQLEISGKFSLILTAAMFVASDIPLTDGCVFNQPAIISQKYKLLSIIVLQIVASCVQCMIW